MILNNFNEIFSSDNLLIMFINILAFMLIEIVFYWFILSRQLDKVVSEKSSLLIEFIDLNSTINSIKSKENFKFRTWYNYLLIIEYLGPMIYAMVGILLLIVIYKMKMYKIINILLGVDWRGNNILLSTKILILFVIFVFFTELIFFFVIVNNWKFITDAEIMLIFVE